MDNDLDHNFKLLIDRLVQDDKPIVFLNSPTSIRLSSGYIMMNPYYMLFVLNPASLLMSRCFVLFQGPGGDTDPSKNNGDKATKAQSPFEGEVKPDDQSKDLVASNGIMPNGLEDR